MDYSLSSDDMGKNSGDDFLDQKITLPLIIAYGDGTDTERQFWQRTIGDGAFADGDFEEACDILQRYDAIDRSVAEAVRYARAADRALMTHCRPLRTTPTPRFLTPCPKRQNLPQRDLAAQ